MLRFNDFREIVARFDSRSTDCGKRDGGHAIKRGESIGYCRRHTVCTDCWQRWVAENAEADLYESNLTGYGY